MLKVIEKGVYIFFSKPEEKILKLKGKKIFRIVKKGKEIFLLRISSFDKSDYKYLVEAPYRVYQYIDKNNKQKTYLELFNGHGRWKSYIILQDLPTKLNEEKKISISRKPISQVLI